MSTFKLKSFHREDPSADVEVVLTDNITEEQLLNFPGFATWRHTLEENLSRQYSNEKHAFRNDPYKLQHIKVQSVDWFGPRKIGFIKIEATLRNKNSKHPLPGVAFLRGGSVAILIILRPHNSRDERWVVMTEQPRVPAGSLSFFEIPAGMLDPQNSNNFSGQAATEIKEETGLTLKSSELINLTELALQNSKGKELLQDAMYPSPGGSDEFISIFLWEKELDRQEIEDLRDKITGKRQQGEMITLQVCDYEDLWQHGARDAKTLAAWALYEGLNRQGKIQEERLRMSKADHTNGGHEETE